MYVSLLRPLYRSRSISWVDVLFSNPTPSVEGAFDTFAVWIRFGQEGSDTFTVWTRLVRKHRIHLVCGRGVRVDIWLV